MTNIFNFWILDRSSGICIFEQNFEEWPGKDKSEIVAGFLYAILSISKEFADDFISYIELKDKFRISYRLSKNLVFVVLSSRIEQSWIASILERLELRFEEKFPDFFNCSFYGETSQFQCFAKETEKIFQLETNYYSYIKTRKEHLGEYLQRATKEWKDFRKLFATHTKKIADWTVTKEIKIDEDVEKDLIQSRKKGTKKPEIDDTTKGSWV